MISHWKRIVRYASLALSVCLLVTVLAACDGSNGTAEKQPTPTAVQWLLYQGAGFTMNYPSNWHKNASGDQVTFADPVGKDLLAIFADPDLGSEPDTNAVAKQAMSRFEGTLLANAQAVNVPPTFSTGKVTWIQLSATGELAVADPGVQGNLFLLVTNYPPQTKNTVTYQIEYYGPSATFGQANASFMRMLQSINFASA